MVAFLYCLCKAGVAFWHCQKPGLRCYECDLQGFNAVYFGRSPPAFRRNLSPPSSGSKLSFFNWLLLAYYLVYSSTLKTEALHSYEKLVNFCRITRRYYPEDHTFRSRCFGNLKSNLLLSLLFAVTYLQSSCDNFRTSLMVCDVESVNCF